MRRQSILTLLFLVTLYGYGQSYDRDTINPIFVGGFGLSLDYGAPDICVVGARQFSLLKGRIDIFAKNNGEWQSIGLPASVNIGNNNGDKYGYSVTMPSPNRIAVGAPNDDDAGASSGSVRILSSFNGGASWYSIPVLLTGDTATENFGSEVHMPSENVLAVGAPGSSKSFPYGGVVRVFQYQSSSWSQKGADITGSGNYASAGQAVFMPDENTIAVGEPGYNSQRGLVKIYKWNGSSWQLNGLPLLGSNPGDRFGQSISMPDSSTICIGALGSDTSITNGGAVYVYESSSSGNWSLKGSVIQGINSGENFGHSVAMPNKNLFFGGAPKYSVSYPNAGSCYKYDWNATTSDWVKSNSFQESGQGGGDHFGEVVKALNNRLLVSAPFFDTINLNDVGRVYEYDFCNIPLNYLNLNSCGPAYLPSGTQVLQSGTYSDTLITLDGCDSIFQVTVNITYDNTAIYRSGDTLFCNDLTLDSYQWIDCDSNTAISGENYYYYVPSKNGRFSLFYQLDNCIDTTSCISVIDLSQTENRQGQRVYPNPANRILTVEGIRTPFNYAIISAEGKKIEESISFTKEIIISHLSVGNYVLVIDEKKIKFNVAK